MIEPSAQAINRSRNFTHAQKAALAFGSADEDRLLQLARSFCHRLKCYEVGDIEVADRDLPVSSIVQHLAERRWFSRRPMGALSVYQSTRILFCCAGTSWWPHMPASRLKQQAVVDSLLNCFLQPGDLLLIGGNLSLKLLVSCPERIVVLFRT